MDNDAVKYLTMRGLVLTTMVQRLRNPEAGKGKSMSKDQQQQTQAEKSTGDSSTRLWRPWQGGLALPYE